MGRRSARYDEGLFIVEGPVLIREALDAGIHIREVYLRDDAPFKVNGIDEYELDAKTFDSISDTVTPQGAMALCEMPEAADLPHGTVWVMAAHEISDPGNLGTLMRSCEAAGAHALVLVGSCVDPFSPKVVRASAGAVFRIPVVHVDKVEDLVTAGFTVHGTSSHTESITPVSLYDMETSGRLAIVLGNEAHGLPANSPVSGWITIPHAGRAESLNVAMAGTVISMYVSRQRGK
jgi:TrmH family RNA methyltransferase